MSFGGEHTCYYLDEFWVYVDLSRLPSLLALEIVGVLKQEIYDHLIFCGVINLIQKFTPINMRPGPTFL